MADNIVVKGAMVSLTPVVSTVQIVSKTHTLSNATSGPFYAIEGNEVFLEEDIDASFSGYTTPYLNSDFVGGTLEYQSLKSISNLSELTNKKGNPVVTKKTQGTITCKVSQKAIKPPPPPGGTPDPLLTYDLDFSFTDAGQTLSNSD